MALRQYDNAFQLDETDYAPLSLGRSDTSPSAQGASFNSSLLGGSALTSPTASGAGSVWEGRSTSLPTTAVSAQREATAAPASTTAAAGAVAARATSVPQDALARYHVVDLSAAPVNARWDGFKAEAREQAQSNGNAGTDYTPGDTLYDSQWHFAAISHGGVGIEDIWNDYTGEGVAVGVYDSGFQQQHFDLAGNVDASRNFVYEGVTYSEGWSTGESGHGTSVAGLIAASNNGINTVGVAFDASITTVDIFDADDPAFINADDTTGFIAALDWAADHFDVINNSWGATPGYFTYPNNFNVLATEAFGRLAEDGRDGLGTIVVKSAGNEDVDANGDMLNASRWTITVGSVGDSGWVSSYSNYGHNLLVSAQGGDYVELGSQGTWTTDLLGTGGYNLRSDETGSYDYTDDFGGTSSAAPIVSAVIALMLEANENLGWRDVQNILAYSAHMPTNTVTGEERPPYEDYSFVHYGEWQSNGGSNWNGGGAHYNGDYGYGEIDVYNAVRMAEAWSLFGEAQTSANEYTSAAETIELGLAIGPNVGTNSTTFEVTEAMVLEHLSLTIDLTHSWFSDVLITLISPEGTVLTFEGYGSSAADAGLTWTYGIDSLRGEQLAGTWTVQVEDRYTGDGGILDSLTFQGYGAQATTNDVYHYTDEFFVTQALFEENRTLLSDTNGGTDWINAAAISGDLFLNLAGTSTYMDETIIQIAVGTVIENAVLGDGDDVVVGNSATNELYGMRGNDSLDGGAGADTLIGGVGDDIYYIDNDGDVVVELENEGIDTIYSRRNADLTVFANVENATLLGGFNGNLTGNDDNNILIGNGGNNVINGGLGDDFMSGGGGNDTYWIDSLGDVILESAGGGVDTVVSPFDLVLGANFENGTLLGSANLNITGNASNNILTGNAGNNVLDGGSGGADTFIGGAGDDTYYLNSTTDTVVELAGEGYDIVHVNNNFSAVGQAIEEVILSGTANSHLTGNELANRLVGNSGNNAIDGGAGADVLEGNDGNDTLTGGLDNDTLIGGNGNDVLNGGAGGDTMIGGAGNDTYYVNSTADVVTELAGAGIDQVFTTISFRLAGTGIENATLIGSLARNLTGNELNNRLIGNDAANIISGGLGGDVLTGGGGADVFDYNSILETTQAASDRITDISSDDWIDLSGIDANTTTGGNQAFSLVSAFSGVAGQLIVLYDSGTDTTGVYGDVNGDGLSDFRIVLAGGDHSAFSNFVL